MFFLLMGFFPDYYNVFSEFTINGKVVHVHPFIEHRQSNSKTKHPYWMIVAKFAPDQNLASKETIFFF